ncbi:MAG: hypothetical protein ACP5XB_12060 [Isosphaeraceae bacterium]
MTGNFIDSTPLTPFPDPPSHSGEEPAPEPAGPPGAPARQPDRPDIATSSADDLALLLAQSVPDPFLDSSESQASPVPPAGAAGSPVEDPASALEAGLPGGSAEPARPLPDISGAEPASIFASLSSSGNDVRLPVMFTPPPDFPVPGSLTPRRVQAASGTSADDREDQRRPGVSWPLLLVASYASAVTLSLIWILWTGRVSSRPRPAAESRQEASSGDLARTAKLRSTARRPPPLPAQNLTTVGTTMRLGELEVSPFFISRREIELERLDGFADETRQVGDVLVLTLRLTNRSPNQTFTPLEPAFVRGSGSADDDSFIETASGTRIPLYQLAPESEWSIRDQHFPILKPGEQAETIIVSEPVRMIDLAGPLIWRLKIRTGTYRTDVLGIRFNPDNISDGGF